MWTIGWKNSLFDLQRLFKTHGSQVTINGSKIYFRRRRRSSLEVSRRIFQLSESQPFFAREKSVDVHQFFLQSRPECNRLGLLTVRPYRSWWLGSPATTSCRAD